MRGDICAAREYLSMDERKREIRENRNKEKRGRKHGNGQRRTTKIEKRKEKKKNGDEEEGKRDNSRTGTSRKVKNKEKKREGNKAGGKQGRGRERKGKRHVRGQGTAGGNCLASPGSRRAEGTLQGKCFLMCSRPAACPRRREAASRGSRHSLGDGGGGGAGGWLGGREEDGETAKGKDKER